MSKSYFEDLIFQFPSNQSSQQNPLHKLLSNHINLKSYNPSLNLQKYLKIKSFKSYAIVHPSRTSPFPCYHIEVCPNSSWIILLITLQGRFNIAFVDLKTYKLIKVVKMENSHILSTAYSSVDDSGTGSFLYLLGIDYNLYKFDLERVFNHDYYEDVCTSPLCIKKPEYPKAIWKSSSHINNSREIYKKTALNIVKIGDKITIMLCDGSHFAYYSTIDGSLIKIDCNRDVMQLNIKSIQSGIMLSESDKIIFLNNANELCWIELNTLKIVYRAKLDFEPSYSTFIRIDEFSKQIILCEGNGHFSVVNWEGKLLKTFNVAPLNSEKQNRYIAGSISKYYSCSPSIYQQTGELFYCYQYLLARLK